ncbi:hypothetical protein AOLI_G00036650 [Acnodon oligacanthus]
MGCRALERATVFSESKELFKFSSADKNQGGVSVESAMMLADGELGLCKGTGVSWEGLPTARAREPELSKKRYAVINRGSSLEI